MTTSSSVVRTNSKVPFTAIVITERATTMSLPIVLIVTNRYDVHADHLVPMIEARGAQVFRFNTERLLADHQISWNSTGIGTIRNRHHEVAIEDVTSVWYRKPNDYEMPDEWLDYEEFLREELRATIGGLYRCLSHVNWVNPLDAQRRASYKLLQLRVATCSGLSVPEYIVTNDPLEAAAFGKRHQEHGLAIKTIGKGLVHLPPGKTIFTNRLTAKRVDQPDRISGFPHFLQAYVPKKSELRITIVGDDIFACEMQTQDSPNPKSREDWRRYDLDHVSYAQCELPELLEEKLRQLMNSLGLIYGAVDVVRTPDDQFVFLEINPGGQWLWVEQRTEMPVSEAIADYLVNAEPTASHSLDSDLTTIVCS